MRWIIRLWDWAWRIWDAISVGSWLIYGAGAVSVMTGAVAFFEGVSWHLVIFYGLGVLCFCLVAAAAARTLLSGRVFVSENKEEESAAIIEFGRVHPFKFNFAASVSIKQHLENAIITARAANAVFYMSETGRWEWIGPEVRVSDVRNYNRGEFIEIPLAHRNSDTPDRICVLGENVDVSGQYNVKYIGFEISIKSKEHTLSAVEVVAAYNRDAAITAKASYSAINLLMIPPPGAVDELQWPRGTAT